MRARDLAALFLTVGLTTPAIEAAVLEIAALMARARSPLVAVVDSADGLLGAITLDALFDRVLAS